MQNLLSLNHSFMTYQDAFKIVPDGYIQIGFQNLGGVPFSVCNRVLNSGEVFYPNVYGGVFIDETQYEIHFADVAGDKLAWVHKTYII